MKIKLSAWMQQEHGGEISRRTAIRRLEAGLYPGYKPVKIGGCWYVEKISAVNEILAKVS